MIKTQGYNRILIFLFALSGANGLVYEVLWLRYFIPVFGLTVYATSIVLAAFMAGLALGSYLFGKWAENVKSPLRIYSYLEVGIGLYALLMPFILFHFNSTYRMIYLHWSDNLSLIHFIRLAASLIILLVPTVMMGATLPVISKYFVAESRKVGEEGGKLYAFNTLGAVIGATCAGFILIPRLGVSKTNYIAASLSVLIGITVLVSSARVLKVSVSASAAADGINMQRKGKRNRYNEVVDTSYPGHQWMIILMGFSGFAALSYEIIWTKIISIITFSTVFAFTSMLVAFLLGIGIGSYIFSKYLHRMTNLWAWFIVIQISIGAYALLSSHFFTNLAGHYYGYQMSVATFEVSWWVFAFKQFLLADIIMLFPTILMGASFPLACKIYAVGSGRISTGVGNIYAGNTLGALAGSLLTGIIFIPLLGLKGSLLIAVSLNLGAAALGLHLSSTSGGKNLRRLTLIVPVVGLLYVYGMSSDPALMKYLVKNNIKIIFHREDATGMVEVVEENGIRTMITNRLHTEGSNKPDSIILQKRQGYLPLLLHPNPQSFIEVGLGTGIGFAPVIYEKVKEAEMVEISSGVVEAAEYFKEENGNILDNPKVTLLVNDGSNHLFLTTKKYDLIVLGLFTPYRMGVGNLYTRETYIHAGERLKEDGMVVQWLGLHQFSPDNLRILVNTFRSTFPFVYMWEKWHYVALVGRKKRLRIDFQKFKDAFMNRSIKTDLEKWKLNDPDIFLSSFLMGPEGIRKFAQGAPLNTEDRPRIEFSNMKVSKAAYSYLYAGKNLSSLLKLRKPPFPYIYNISDVEKQKLKKDFNDRRYLLLKHIRRLR